MLTFVIVQDLVNWTQKLTSTNGDKNPLPEVDLDMMNNLYLVR
jgi:hypothetical protein